jgi:transcriptional regulator with XRE-family HTH domain
MNFPIRDAATVGKVVRAGRKAQKIRQDDAAGSIGVSENFLGKVERGSGSVQWGKLFQVLEGLGVRVMVDLPEGVAPYLRDRRSDRGVP